MANGTPTTLRTYWTAPVHEKDKILAALPPEGHLKALLHASQIAHVAEQQAEETERSAPGGAEVAQT